MSDELPVLPPQRPALHPTVDEAMIRRLVFAFYGKVREDPTLAPVFAAAIEDWQPHLEKMCDFWSSVALGSGRYKGRPVPAHFRLPGLTPAHFERWLALFRETAAEVAGPEAAPLFVERAERIAQSLQLALFFRPGAAAWPAGPGR